MVVEFKKEFWRRYKAGEAPTEILRALGYDTKILGRKQISNRVQSVRSSRSLWSKATTVCPKDTVRDSRGIAFRLLRWPSAAPKRSEREQREGGMTIRSRGQRRTSSTAPAPEPLHDLEGPLHFRMPTLGTVVLFSALDNGYKSHYKVRRGFRANISSYAHICRLYLTD